MAGSRPATAARHTALILLQVWRKYAPLLLAGGLIDVLPEDLPTELADPFDMLSFLFLDGAGVSKLGIHTDTDQLMPCVCSCDSLYPPGCYDFTGGEFSWANGVWADPYARNDAVIVLGHTTTHTVLPLTPSGGVPDARPELRGCTMLRGSIVHWSKGGQGLCEEWRELAARERADGAPGGRLWEQKWSTMRGCMQLLCGGVHEGVGTRRSSGMRPVGIPLWRPEAEHIARVVGGLALRLRGGMGVGISSGVVLGGKCKKRKR